MPLLVITFGTAVLLLKILPLPIPKWIVEPSEGESRVWLPRNFNHDPLGDRPFGREAWQHHRARELGLLHTLRREGPALHGVGVNS